MLPNLHLLLLNRLHQQGANAVEAPALLRDLPKVLESDPGIDMAAANSELHLLGWNSHLRKSIIDAILRAEGYRL
jgi:hypothetical protein